MKVHYTSSLWSSEKGTSGVVQKTNWQFEHLGLKRCIPCVYHFREGVVFDVLTFLDVNKMKAYLEKYEELADELTPIEQQCAEQEHPYKEMNIREIWLDDHRIEEGFASSASINIPFASENDELLTVQKAYRTVLEDTTCFSCQRFCVPYPKAKNTLQKLFRSLRVGRINALKLITCEQHRVYPMDLRFTLSNEDCVKTVIFVHPATGTKHKLYLQIGEASEIPRDVSGKQPFYFVEANYEIEPTLHQNDQLQFDSSITYFPQPVDDFGPTASSSIGIIGGSDGPTAIFMTNKGNSNVPCGSHGLPLHTCFSTITMEKSQTAQFVIKGLDVNMDDSEVYSLVGI